MPENTEYQIKRSDKTIERLLDKVSDEIYNPTHRYTGMTYADGLRNMLEWLTADDDDSEPMQDS